MSLLLEALRKADRERESRDRAPGIDARHSSHSAQSRRGSIVVVALVLALAVLSAVVVWLLLDVREPDAPQVFTVQSDTAVATRSLPERTSESEREPEPEPAASEQSAPSNAAPSTVAQERPTEVQMIGEAYRRDGQTAQSRETPTDESGEAAERESVDDLYQQAQRPQSEPAAPTAPAQPVAAAQNRFSDLDVIRDLPQTVQNTIPSLIYGEHNYSADGAGDVMINGRRWREGQEIADGVVLETIVEQGIILRKNDYRFRLMALSSWVNM